jgi:type II secretory pathway pseudopilin PulG
MTPISMNPFRRTQGFILIEVVIAMAIFMGMVSYGLYLQNLAYRTEQGKRVGQQYAAINKAVGNYMVTHYTVLKDKRVECSTTTFKVGMSETFTPMNCGFQISSKVGTQPDVNIANAMQPTVAELIAAGYLPADKAGVVPGVPSLPMDSVVAEADPITGAASITKAVGRLFINIDRVCLATHTANPGTVSAPQKPDPTTGLCDPLTTTTSLTSLVFNTQPFQFSNASILGFVNRMDGVWTEIGADAAMSHTLNGGELKGANFQVTNPIRQDVRAVANVMGVTYVAVGLPGIVAVRNGYGANYANNHARVDGSNPPTADWSFANNSISGVGKMTALTVDADVLKLGDRTAGAACDATKENVSFGAGTILMCTASKWTPLGSKGTVNGLDYYEYVAKKSGSTRTVTFTCTRPPCIDGGLSFSSNDNYFLTWFQKDAWLPVLVRYGDSGSSDFGFEVNSAGNYYFMFDTNVATIVVRFYRINL